MRRSGDVLIACVLLAITLPLLIITAAAIRLGSSGPILERRARTGAGGRQFQVLVGANARSRARLIHVAIADILSSTSIVSSWSIAPPLIWNGRRR
jgi:ABC-type transport system involved in cytochrome c biogenesis permease component